MTKQNKNSRWQGYDPRLHILARGQTLFCGYENQD